LYWADPVIANTAIFVQTLLKSEQYDKPSSFGPYDPDFFSLLAHDWYQSAEGLSTKRHLVSCSLHMFNLLLVVVSKVIFTSIQVLSSLALCETKQARGADLTGTTGHNVIILDISFIQKIHSYRFKLYISLNDSPCWEARSWLGQAVITDMSKEGQRWCRYTIMSRFLGSLAISREPRFQTGFDCCRVFARHGRRHTTELRPPFLASVRSNSDPQIGTHDSPAEVCSPSVLRAHIRRL